MSTRYRNIKAKYRRHGFLLVQFHLKPNAAWRARKRWNREHRRNNGSKGR